MQDRAEKLGGKMLKQRIIGINEIEAIIEFDKLCFPTDFWKRSDWEELLGDERAVYYAMTDGNRIVGDLFIYNWAGESDYIKIMNLAVHPDYRGGGIAGRLIENAEKEMERSGLSRICGETRESNSAMRRLFEKCGYKLNKTEPDYYENPTEAGCKYVFEAK